MNGEALDWLAGFLSSPSGSTPLVMGRVLSVQPLRVTAEGNAQDADSLLKNAGLEMDELKAGDQLALWPIEEHQRYVILCKVVSL